MEAPQIIIHIWEPHHNKIVATHISEYATVQPHFINPKKHKWVFFTGQSVESIADICCNDLGLFLPFLNMAFTKQPHGKLQSRFHFFMTSGAQPYPDATIDTLFAQPKETMTTVGGKKNANEAEFFDELILEQNADDIVDSEKIAGLEDINNLDGFISNSFEDSELAELWHNFSEPQEKEVSTTPTRLDVKNLSLVVDPKFHFDWQHNKLSVTDAGCYTHVLDYIEIWVTQLEPYLYSFACYENIEVIQMVINRFWPGALSYLSSSLRPTGSVVDISQKSLRMHAKWILEEFQKIYNIEHPFVPMVTGFSLIMQDAQMNSIKLPLRNIYNSLKFNITLQAAALVLPSTRGTLVYNDALAPELHLPSIVQIGRTDALIMKFVFDDLYIKVTITSLRRIIFDIVWTSPSHQIVHGWEPFLEDYFKCIIELAPIEIRPFIKRNIWTFFQKRKFHGSTLSVIVNGSYDNTYFNATKLQQGLERLSQMGLISTYNITNVRRIVIRTRIVGVPVPKQRLQYFQRQYHIHNLVNFKNGQAGTPDQHNVWNKVFAGVRIGVRIIGSLFYIQVENLSLENIALVHLPVNLIISLLQSAQEPMKEGALENTNSTKLLRLYSLDKKRFTHHFSTQCQFRKQPSVVETTALSSLTTSERNRTITLPSLVTNQNFTLLCPREFPVPNLIVNTQGFAGVCCNRENIRKNTYRWGVQQILRQKHSISLADEQKLAEKYGYNISQIGHILGFSKTFTVGRLYSLDPRWTELSVISKEYSKPNLLCLVDFSTPVSSIAEHLLDLFGFTVDMLINFIHKQGNNLIWTIYESMDVTPTIDILAEFLESGIANINFKAEEIFLLVLCFLTLEHDIVCFPIENVQHELFVDLQNKNIAASIMRLDENVQKKCCIFITRKRSQEITIMRWGINDMPGTFTQFITPTDPLIKNIFIPMVSDFLEKQQTLTISGLHNKKFTVLGIFHYPEKNLFGGLIEWREYEIFVPCIPVGSDFSFEMLPSDDIERGRTNVEIVLALLENIKEQFNIKITEHYISVLPETNLSALLVTSLGPWLLTPEPYVGTITKLDNGLATYYPYPVKLTPNFIVNEAISKIIYMREIKHAFVYQLIEGARNHSDNKHRIWLHEQLEMTASDEIWGTLLLLLKEPINITLLQQTNRYLFDLETFEGINFTFDRNYLHTIANDFI